MTAASGFWRAAIVLPSIPSLLVFGPTVTAAQELQTLAVSRRASGETKLDVSVRYGAGRLQVIDSDSGLLYSMRLRYDPESTRSIAEYEDGRLEVGVQARSGLPGAYGEDGGELALALGRDREIDLTVEFGAGELDVDLGGLSLHNLAVKTGASDSRVNISSPNPVALSRASFEVGAASLEVREVGNLNVERLDVSAGVGSVTLDFNGDWRQDAEVSLRIGMGSLELSFPADLGVRVEQSGFLASFDGGGLVKRGDAYYSADWDTAEHRVLVDIEAAFGSTTVRKSRQHP